MLSSLSWHSSHGPLEPFDRLQVHWHTIYVSALRVQRQIGITTGVFRSCRPALAGTYAPPELSEPAITRTFGGAILVDMSPRDLGDVLQEDHGRTQ
jgi:hypothetical protein